MANKNNKENNKEENNKKGKKKDEENDKKGEKHGYIFCQVKPWNTRKRRSPSWWTRDPGGDPGEGGPQGL